MIESILFLNDPDKKEKKDDEAIELAQALALYERHLEDSE